MVINREEMVLDEAEIQQVKDIIRDQLNGLQIVGACKEDGGDA